MPMIEDWNEPDIFKGDLVSDVEEEGYEKSFDSGNVIELSQSISSNSFKEIKDMIQNLSQRIESSEQCLNHLKILG